MPTLKVEKRDKTGKYAAFDMRAAGFLPGVVYGKDFSNVNVRIPFKEFEHLLHEGQRILDLDIEGTVQQVLVKEVQHGVFAHEILHADFRAISATDTLNVTIPVVLKGEARGIQEGGMMEQTLFDVEIECLPKDLPDEVTVDVSAMNVGDVRYVSDLPAIEGVTFVTDPGEPVASCNMPDVEEEAEPAEEGEEAVAEPEVIGEKERVEEEGESED